MSEQHFRNRNLDADLKRPAPTCAADNGHRSATASLILARRASEGKADGLPSGDPVLPHGTATEPGSIRPVRSWVWLLLGALVWLLPVTLWAGSGNAITLPATGANPKNGARVEIDSSWVDANGYRPIRVEISNWPSGPSTSDRNFRILLRPQGWGRGESVTAVTQDVVLSAGQSQVQATLSVPQHGPWSSLEVEVYEDGYRLKDLCLKVGLSMNYPYAFSEAVPAILFIDSDSAGISSRAGVTTFSQSPGSQPNRLPDLRLLVTQFPNYTGGSYSLSGSVEPRDSETLNLLSAMPRVAMFSPSELPTRWLDYTCFDLIFVSLEDLRKLVEQNPRAWQAIQAWLLTGPTLCVCGVDLDGDQLAELERLVGPTGGAIDSPPARNARPWLEPRSSDGRQIRGLENSQGNRASISITGGPDPAAQNRVPYRLLPVGQGRLAALRDKEPFSPNNAGTVRMFNDLDQVNWRWYQRHGVSMRRENPDYWKFTIPGVGAAPVNSYLVLITLFAIAIGPVNYVLLRRKRRLYLLLVTVPAGAAVVTFALVNYALISDGLGVRARIRSVTEIDQRRGHAVTWARQSYYAGLAPSQGLVFPEDVACYPIDQFPGEQKGERRLQWDEAQRLTSGYLVSRSSSQFLAVRSHPSQLGLDIHDSPGAPAAPRVTNRLGTSLEQLVVRDKQGAFFVAEDVAAGASCELTPETAANIESRLRAASLANRPDFPLGYNVQSFERGFGSRRNSAYWNSSDQNLPLPRMDDGILERRLRLVLYGSASGLAQGSYVAFTRTAPDLALGAPAAREEASFHVVLGRW